MEAFCGDCLMTNLAKKRRIQMLINLVRLGKNSDGFRAGIPRFDGLVPAAGGHDVAGHVQVDAADRVIVTAHSKMLSIVEIAHFDVVVQTSAKCMSCIL